MEYYLKRVNHYIREYIQIIGPAIGLVVVITSVLLSRIDQRYGIVPTVLLTIIVGVFILSSRRELVIAILIIFNENVFYMFNRFSLVYVYDLRQLLGILMFGLFILYLPKVIKDTLVFKCEIFLLLCYYFLSILIAYVNIGQDFIEGFYTMFFLMLLLSYFVICYLMETIEIFEKVKNIYILLTIVSGILCIIQSQLYPKIIFMLTDYRWRYDNVRFTEFSVFMSFGLLITFNVLLEAWKLSKIKKFTYIVAFVIQTYTVLMIAQNRMLNFMTLLVLAIALVFLQKKISKINILVLIFLCLVVLISINVGGLISENNILLDSIEEITNVTGNFGIRYNAAIYYFNNMQNHWLVGWGTLNMKNEEAIWISGIKYLYYLVDVGIMGYIYKFGLIGTLLTYFLIFKSIYKSIKIYRRDCKVYYPLLGNLLILLISPQVFYYQEVSAIFYLGLWYAFTEFEYRKSMYTISIGKETA